MVQQGVAASKEGAIVTFGISPTYPSTAYGYIRQGSARSDGAFNVDGFNEKPPQSMAETLLLSGRAFWNAGIFLCSAKTLLNALSQHAPDILQACQQAMHSATQDGSFVRPQPQAFEACRSESIDYAVMEHHANVAVVPFASAWSDVGSWNAVAVHTLVPGLTGCAQVNGRDELPIPEKVKLDVAYLQRQSLWFDICILWLTFVKVLKRDGVSH